MELLFTEVLKCVSSASLPMITIGRDSGSICHGRERYDVEKFVTYRNSGSKQTEARVRFVGYGPEEDEWLNVKESIRECSLGIDPSECQNLNPGNHVVCFLEKNDCAKYYDAHIVEIKRKMHDARGCRCDFRIRYNHDNVEETVDLNRLYRRPELERPHQRAGS